MARDRQGVRVLVAFAWFHQLCCISAAFFLNIADPSAVAVARDVICTVGVTKVTPNVTFHRGI